MGIMGSLLSNASEIEAEKLEAELKIWLTGESAPLVRTFRNDASVHDIYRLLSMETLR